MKISRINGNKEGINEKIKIIEITNHGIRYTITSDFKGIRIENNHNNGVSIFPCCKNQVVIK